MNEEEYAPVSVVEEGVLEIEGPEEDELVQPPRILLWKTAYPIAVGVTIVPSLLGLIWYTVSLTGQHWPATFLVLHLMLVTGIHAYPRPRPWILGVWSVVEIGVFWKLYAKALQAMGTVFYLESDGSPVIEWTKQWTIVVVIRRWCISAALANAVCLVLLVCRASAPGNYRPSLKAISKSGRVFQLMAGASLAYFLFCGYSIDKHFRHKEPPLQQGSHCNPLDTTECFYPFPSFHYLEPDASTETGWRVQIPSEALPPLRDGSHPRIDFVNELDGFSTMGPILFYVEGLREAHEADVQQLFGPPDVARSITAQSATFLVDVEEGTLVAHSAEIDHLDPERPSVLVFPAQPLHHNRHYAMALVNAVDANGKRLPVAEGLRGLLASDSEQRERFQNTVIPALESALPDFLFEGDPDALQMLFDFHTTSASSQIGPLRSMRDAALQHVRSADWGSWSDHARAMSVVNFDCAVAGQRMAREVHVELDVPWFLSSTDRYPVQLENPTKPSRMGSVRFLVQIPCSLQEATVGQSDVLAGGIMEYGHSLFGSYDLAREWFLQEFAENERFVMVAMDWRGMCRKDFPVVFKMILGDVSLFETQRNNLMQGYIAKLVMQEFTRVAMFEQEWAMFKDAASERLVHIPRSKEPLHVYHGVSQGAILGAGYTALAGGRGLIDRSILSTPGTPFASIMSRSADFRFYDKALKTVFFNNRHVRMALGVLQLGYDQVEGSGFLAAPIEEPFPPTIIQAGMGDTHVPSLTAESLARAYGAVVLPHNPRQDVFGVPSVAIDPSTAIDERSEHKVVLTELYYDKEYHLLPTDNVFGYKNSVHHCVKFDPVIREQVDEFLARGRIIDPCEADGCYREHSCW